jgi:hypothetical protein
MGMSLAGTRTEGRPNTIDTETGTEDGRLSVPDCCYRLWCAAQPTLKMCSLPPVCCLTHPEDVLIACGMLPDPP